MVEYVYIIQIREFLGTNIYKIGRTKQECLKRVCSYPKGTILVLQVACKDCEKIEREVINVFKSNYMLRQDLGNEYFEGEKKSMMIDMFDIVMNEGKEDVKEDVKEEEKQEKKDIITMYESMKRMSVDDRKVYIEMLSKEEYNGYLKYCKKISNAKYHEKNKEKYNNIRRQHIAELRKEDVERQRELNRKHQREYRARIKKNEGK